MSRGCMAMNVKMLIGIMVIIMPTIVNAEQFGFNLNLGGLLAKSINKPDKVYQANKSHDLVIDREQVVVFGRDSCPYTRNAVSELKRKHIPFQYYKVDELYQQNQNRYFRLIYEAGAYADSNGVPMIVYKGKGVMGYSKGIIRKLMRAKSPQPRFTEVEVFGTKEVVEGYCSGLSANGMTCKAYTVGQLHELNNRYMMSQLRKFGYNGPSNSLPAQPVVITERGYLLAPSPDKLFSGARIAHGKTTGKQI